ncbi:MAG: PAS domain-containing protein, partial [Thermodesulfobacteriota bacterium]|nr:PAS domain-containing protein [Thermodesulfobacteriota bacterium]
VNDNGLSLTVNAVAVIDLEGDMIYVNRSFLQMWGYYSDKDMDRDIVNTWLEWAVTASTLRYLNRYLQIHSGGVVKDGKAMIFIGESGAGKTSLLIGLSMMGLSLLSDDINLLDKDCHSIIPYPRNFLIKEDIINHIPQIVPFLNKTKGHFQSGKGKVWYLDPFLLGSGLYFKPSTPSEIIILERSKTPETDIWEASKAEMAIPLLKAVFNPVSKESDIMKFLPLLLREVKCYRISIGSLKEGVNKIINLLDRRR